MENEFNLSKELEEEQERIEKEMKECECGQGIGVELGKCNIHDVLYAKHEGIRFASEKFNEFIKRLKEEIEKPTYPYANIFQLIDKLAGEKLK
jgi:hypothetical protein